MTPEAILQTIAIAVSGWTLLEVIKLKTSVAVIEQQIDDLPCGERSQCAVSPNNKPKV